MKSGVAMAPIFSRTVKLNLRKCYAEYDNIIFAINSLEKNLNKALFFFISAQWKSDLGFSGDVWCPMKLLEHLIKEYFPTKRSSPTLFSQLCLQRPVERHSVREGYEAVEALAFDRMRSAHNGSFYNSLVLHQSRLHLRCTQQVTCRGERQRKFQTNSNHPPNTTHTELISVPGPRE